MATKVVICWIFVFISSVQIKAVSVNPDSYLCPTNKIAPHRRISNGKPRTFGAYYDLLTPSFNQQQAPLDDLQEEPQKDDPDDCGDIEDYDENDLSSLTSPQQQRRGRFFFGTFRPPVEGARPPPNYPQRPPQESFPGPRPPQSSFPVPRPPQGNFPVPRPPQGSFPPPQGSFPAPRPPYWSGGQFGDNPYRPPAHHYPSDSIKPVYEDGVNDHQEPYRPGIVGGPSHNVVGISSTPFRPPRPSRPSNNPNRDPIPGTQTQNSPSYDNQEYTTTLRPQSSSNYERYTTRKDRQTTRRPRPRKLNNNDSIIGSFLDLLF